LALKDRVQLILSVKDTPHRLSLAFSLGIFIGMSPLLGFHTILGILVSSVFRLNRLVTLAGVFVTNPWTIIPIYTFSTWVGARCLGIKSILPDIDWNHITFGALLNDFRPLLMPFIFGTVLIGVVSSLISYTIIYHLTKKKNA
jgi:uncharacterized protein (DUF2062 family)